MPEYLLNGFFVKAFTVLVFMAKGSLARKSGS